jgi:drug/metabolite transporter (DMT)-like permease
MRGSPDTRRQRSAGWAADLGLVTSTLIWGSSFVIIRDTVRGLDPYALVAYRFWLAAAAMGLILLATRRLGFTRSELRGGLGLGLLLGAGFLTQTLGLTATGAANSAFITGLLVVFTPILAAALGRSAPPLAGWVAVALATSGLALLSLRPEVGLNAGDALTLLCAVFFALHIVFTARTVAPGSVDPLRLNFVQFGAVAALALLFALPGTGARAAPDLPALAAIAYLALLATVFAYFVQTVAQRFTSETKVAIIFTLEPVFAALFAFTVGAEVFTPRMIAGCALILAGMLLAELYPRLSARIRADAVGVRRPRPPESQIPG